MSKSPLRNLGGMSFADIYVSRHAIQAYKKKMFCWDKPNEKVEIILKNIAWNGYNVCPRPGNACEVRLGKQSVVASIGSGQIYIITFLGDKNYQVWSRKAEIQPRYHIKHLA